MNYGSEVWGFHKSQQVERVHLRFLKQILAVRQQTCYMIVYGELGRVPLYVSRKVRIVKYWYKILSDPCTLLNKVYKQEANDVDNNSNMKSWSANVKSLLNDHGFSYIWNNQDVSQKQLNTVIQRMYDQFYQEFYACINVSSKMKTFKKISKLFILEKYITSVEVEKHRIALSRFRCSAHKLVVAEGRFRGIERSLRTCPLCSMKVIEDEYRFPLVCPVPYCYLFLLSVFILWFSHYVSDIFCKFYVAE